MTDPKSMPGGCLCGAVRFTATPQSHDYTACHCEMCRRWSAGPFLVIYCGGNVQVEDKSALGIYDSSDWAERHFCKKCGTSLFYKLKQQDYYGVSIEAFDDNSRFHFDKQIFIEKKPAHYAFANKTTNKTGAEVFAEFGE